MTDNQYNYEVIMVDDGSHDSSWRVIEQLVKEIRISGVLNSDGIMANPPPFIVPFRLLKER
jgi:glycosyltransferase involved in cell wall biosynthesis